jgi:hypothetical protein
MKASVKTSKIEPRSATYSVLHEFRMNFNPQTKCPTRNIQIETPKKGYGRHLGQGRCKVVV